MKNLPTTTEAAKLTAKRRKIKMSYLEACKIENIEERKAALRAAGFDPL